KNRALQAAERLQAKLRERGDAANEDKLNLLKSVLQSPLFSQILTLQTSIQQLKDQGRQIEVFELLKPPCGGLGFSVVGLRSENRGELGIFVQEIQEGSVAHRDGRLKETDQILAINGQALDQTITHQQAISILQKAKDTVQLVIARGSLPQLISPIVSRSPSAASTLSAHSNPAHWQHVETIELVNDGSGLGFGIVGGKATGVIVKTILPGGVADQVDGTNLQGFTNQQAVEVLRHTGQTVHLTLMRRGTKQDAEPASREDVTKDVALSPVTANVSKDTYQEDEDSLSLRRNTSILPIEEEVSADREEAEDAQQQEAALLAKWQRTMGINYEIVPHVDLGEFIGSSETEDPVLTMTDVGRNAEEVQGPLAMWEADVQNIELEKGSKGLGFSILDYQDPIDPASTVIVIRSLVPGGIAEKDGRLLPGDRLMFVNDVNLENSSLEEAVQALKGAPSGTVRIGVAKPLPLSPEEGYVSAKEDSFLYPPHSCEEEGLADKALFRADLALVNPNDADLADESAFESQYSPDNDSIYSTQASILSLHGSACSDNLNYGPSLPSSPPKDITENSSDSVLDLQMSLEELYAQNLLQRQDESSPSVDLNMGPASGFAMNDYTPADAIEQHYECDSIRAWTESRLPNEVVSRAELNSPVLTDSTG
ncbi:MPDZ, partial [Cervus elaphus hippelaphus]